MPFGLFGSAVAQVGPGRLVALAACVLAFRRLPWVTAMHWSIPALRSWRHGVFAGWYVLLVPRRARALIAPQVRADWRVGRVLRDGEPVIV
jgi:hypothetical protein